MIDELRLRSFILHLAEEAWRLDRYSGSLDFTDCIYKNALLLRCWKVTLSPFANCMYEMFRFCVFFCRWRDRHIHTSPLLRLAFLLVVMVCVCCVVDWRRCGERKRNRFHERRAFFSSLAASVGWRSCKGKRFGWYLSCAFRCNVFGMCLSLSFSSRLFWLMIATFASFKRIEKGLDWNYCEDYRREFTVRYGITSLPRK